jgi:hypothetical protein
MSNGVRELMLLVPKADPGRYWQMRADKTNADMFQLMQDILFYCVGTSNLRRRGDSYIVETNPAVAPTTTVTVARLMAGDNPDPEPGAWRRLAAVLNNNDKIAVTVTEAKLGEGKLAGNKIAHLTGTAKFTLTVPQRKELKDFVTAGGTLVVDAAGGALDFAESAEFELAAIFGGDPAHLGTILPPTHEIFAALSAPRVRGIPVGGRVAVIYSEEDLTAGLVGEPVDGILGYSPEAATDIMRGIVRYSSGTKASAK